MRRPSTFARSIPERLVSQREDTQEVERALGRGGTALRDAAGNVLVMNPSAPYPLLTPVGTDAAVAFTPGGQVKITSEDGTEDRDMTVRNISSSGIVTANRLTASGDVTASGSFIANGDARFNGQLNAGKIFTGDAVLQNVFANGTLNSTGFTFVGGGLKVGDTYETVGGRITTRELTSLGNMACDGNFYLKGAINPPSDARLKRNFAPLDGSVLDAFREVDWPSWEWKPNPTTDPAPADEPPTRHVMATAQDLRDHPMFRSLVGRVAGPGDEDSDVLGFNLQSLLGMAGAALHEAADRIAELTARVETLEAQRGAA